MGWKDKPITITISASVIIGLMGTAGLMLAKNSRLPIVLSGAQVVATSAQADGNHEAIVSRVAKTEAYIERDHERQTRILEDVDRIDKNVLSIGNDVHRLLEKQGLKPTPLEKE